MNRILLCLVSLIPSVPLCTGDDRSIEEKTRVHRLSNQEGRILIKLPPGMDREAYEGMKTFFRFAPFGGEQVSIGNCAACHAPPAFTDFKSHVVSKGGEEKPTPSLRNLAERDVDLRQAVLEKIAAAKQKQTGDADDIADAYAEIQLAEDDVPKLVKFLQQLGDVEDAKFRALILNSKLLGDTAAVE